MLSRYPLSPRPAHRWKWPITRTGTLLLGRAIVARRRLELFNIRGRQDFRASRGTGDPTSLYNRLRYLAFIFEMNWASSTIGHHTKSQSDLSCLPKVQ